MSVCVLTFFVKDFSGTTVAMFLKFGINVGYDLLYCVKENQFRLAYHSLYLSIFSFSPIKFSVTGFSAPMRAKVSKFYTCIRLEGGQVYCGKENQDPEV